MNYAVDYYHGLMFIALPNILNIYFYTIYVAEGEENICVKASAAMFVVNLILDVVLGYKIGVIGIGIATTIGNLVSFLFHLPYLFSKGCQLKLVKYFDGRKFLPGMFGVPRDTELYSEAVWAVRIFMPFTIFLGVTLMFSNYYIYIERLNLGAVIKTALLLILRARECFWATSGLS